MPSFGGSVYPTALDAFPHVVNGVDLVLDDNMNSVTDAIENLEAKVGIDGSAVVTALDYILKKGRHTSTQPGGGVGSVAFIFDTANAHTGSDKLMSWRSAASERAYFEADGDLVIGVAGSGVLQLGTTDVDKRILAEQAGSPDGEIRYNAATNRWELSDDGGTFRPIATTLQQAYDLGSTVAVSGAVTPVWIRSAADGDEVFATGRTTPSKTHVVFGDGDAVFGAAVMTSTEKLRVVGDISAEGTILLQAGSYSGPFSAAFSVDTDLGVYRVGADSFGIRANTLTLRSPANDPATSWQNNAGTVLFSVGVAGGTYASFSSGTTFDGWRFNRNKTPADSNPVAEFIYNDAAGSAGAGNPLLAAARSISGGSPSAHRVFQVDGDAATTWTTRVTGTTGVSLLLQHKDGQVGVAEDMLGRLAGYGSDDTTIDTMIEFSRIDFRIKSALAATPTGDIRFYARSAAASMRELFVLSANGNTQGALLVSNKSDTSTPNFAFMAGADISAANPVVAVYDNHDVADALLWQVDGSGNVEQRQTLNSAAAGPNLVLFRNRTTDAVDGDLIGVLQWDGMDDGTPSRATYAKLGGVVVDSASVSGPIGRVDLSVVNSGTMARVLAIGADAGGVAAERGARFENFLAAGGVQFEYLLTENSATGGPTFSLFRNRTNAAAAADVIGQLQFAGVDSTIARTVYCQIIGIIDDPTDASEDGRLRFRLLGGGSGRNAIELTSPSGEAILQNFRAAGNVNFEFKLEENSATVGPILSLFRSRTTDAVDADAIGAIYFEGMDDGTPSRTLYAAIAGAISDSGDTSEDGQLVFQAMNAGTSAEVLRIYADGGAAAATRGVVFENKLAAGGTQFMFLLTENSATRGPILSLFRQRTTDAADNDEGGAINWEAMDDGTPTRTVYASNYLKIIDSGDASEDGSLVWDVIQAGAMTAGMRLNNTTSGALEVHASAGTAAKTVGTYDDYDDAMVLRALYPTEPTVVDPWEEIARWERMVEIGVAARKDPNDITKGHMYSVQAMDALIAGGVYQTRARVDRLSNDLDALRNENAMLHARVVALEAQLM